jgi:type II secretory ATPase GspE/PulE/Tfp pilus assembly ATPase PilB-like protein
MGLKITNNIFNYAAWEEAKRLTVVRRLDGVCLNYDFKNGDQKSFHLPKKLEEDLFADLRKVLEIAPGELTAERYCKISSKDSRLTFRLAVLPDGDNEKIIINIIDQPVKPWRLSQLGLQMKDLKTLQSAGRARSGLIIIGAPAGNGKSALLYSLLDALNDAKKNLYCLSANPEQEITGISYLPPTEANWEKILSHDSDIIAIDDLKDTKDLARVLRAAATGRLVIATMTAENPWEILSAILRSDPPLKLKLDCLKMILIQHLADWQQPKSSSAKERRQIGLFEILKMTPKLKQFILASESRPKKNFWKELEKIARTEGFRPLESDRKHKIKAGILKNPKN